MTSLQGEPADLESTTEDPRELFAKWVRKLGERVAFEALQVRLYEALLSKLRAFGTFEGGPSRADLEALLAQEREHEAMLHDILGTLGLPASVTTLFAKDLANSVTGSVSRVLTRPLSSLKDGLEALLVAEFADRRGWCELRELGQRAGQGQWSECFRDAERVEAAQIRQLWAWIRAAQMSRSPSPSRRLAPPPHVYNDVYPKGRQDRRAASPMLQQTGT